MRLWASRLGPPYKPATQTAESAGEFKRPSMPSPAGQRPDARCARPERCDFIVSSGHPFCERSSNDSHDFGLRFAVALLGTGNVAGLSTALPERPNDFTVGSAGKTIAAIRRPNQGRGRL